MTLNVPQWLNALGLRERLMLLAGNEQSCEIDTGLAQQRLATWRSQTPFAKGQYFRQRLALEGIDETTFAHVLGASEEWLRSRIETSPDWLQDIEDVYREYEPASAPSARPAAQTSEAGHPQDEQSEAEQSAALLVIADPFVQDGIKRLRAGVDEIAKTHKHCPFAAQTVDAVFLPGLYRRLRTLLLRTLVLELNVARVMGRLEGSTPEERFDHFQRLLSEPKNAIAMFEEYPVLARMLAVVVSQWVETSIELLARLCHDWPAMQQKFGIAEGAILSSAQIGAGDTHREGRSVTILQFDTEQKIVYKPHPVAINVHFTRLLGWLRERGLQTQFHELSVLDCGSYGWTEFLHFHGCESREGVARFYQRLGGLVALAYVLHSTDMHWENVVAFGEHPVLVDLETLMHPRLPASESLPVSRTLAEAQECSVLRTALLPQRIWMRGESEGIDVSGLGGSGEQLTPMAVTIADQEGTDEMRFVARRVKMQTSQNQPFFEGKRVAVSDFAEEVLSGFEEMYRLIWELRDDFCAESGPLSWFYEDEVRVLVRPTQTYAQVAANAFHPNVLRHGFDHDRALDRLWVGVERRPELASVIDAEQHDLRTGNIPIFFTKPYSRSLWTSNETEIRDFLPEAALDTVVANLNRLSESDLARQLWFIRGSVASMEKTPHPAITGEEHGSAPDSMATVDQLLEAARDIASKLEAGAFHANDRVAWMGLSPVSKDYWSIAPSNFDLYSGTAGIALFLGYAAHAFGERHLRILANVAIHTAIDHAREAQQIAPKRIFTTGLAGIGGLLYACAHLGHLWKDNSLLQEAGSLIPLFSSSLDADQTFDIIGGSAGYICGLLALQDARPSLSLAGEEALRAAERLLGHAQSMRDGIAWDTFPGASAPLTGFSHGTSGIGFALLRLFSTTGDARHRDAAFQAFRYESSQFDVTQKNWYDFRNQNDAESSTQSVAVAWCHGAPGIGLARLYALRFTDDPAIQADLEAALETTWRRGFGIGHCVCHGDLGNVELLLEADKIQPSVGWTSRARTIAAGILRSAEARGWLCGTPSGVETPEFMVGLAGIGYGLLRLAMPTRVPSVLALESPNAQVGSKNLANTLQAMSPAECV